MNAVMAGRVVLTHMGGVDRCKKVQMRGGDWRNRRWDRCIRLNGRSLGLWRGAGTEVVREGRPSLTETGGVHARNHGHNICNV